MDREVYFRTPIDRRIKAHAVCLVHYMFHTESPEPVSLVVEGIVLYLHKISAKTIWMLDAPTTSVSASCLKKILFMIVIADRTASQPDP